MNVTSKYDVLDAKIKNLVSICFETNNEKKLSTVFVVLIRNLVKEKGISMGFPVFIRKDGFKAYIYMEGINKILENNLGQHIFKSEIINETKKLELAFEKSEGKISMRHIPQLIELYYELRKIEVPDFINLKGRSNIENNDNFDYYGPLLRGTNRNSIFPSRKQERNVVKEYLIRDISRKEADLHKSLDERYDKNKIEDLYRLKSLQVKILQHNSQKIGYSGALKKIGYSGALKTNSDYKSTINNIPGYFLLGIGITSILLFSVLLTQSVLYPEIGEVIHGISLFTFCVGFFTITMYWFLYVREGGS
ncbi:MAG: hypothetical protein ACFFAS_20110 [Promethearchaeota archaeon]